MEEWRDVIGYEGLYQVSNLGRVKSMYDERHKKYRELILTPFMNDNGYFRVGLCKDGEKKVFLVHRLVAMTFIPNPENLPEVNHKDEDKTNDVVSNIEWCDRKYNIKYGTRNKRISEALTNGKLSKRVLQINKDTGEVIMEWPSAHEVERQLGYSNAHISKCCLGKYSQVYGFKWKYA